MTHDTSFKILFRQRMYTFVVRLIKYLNILPKDSVTDIMRKQVIRSGSSVLANYVEGGAASSRKDFINFFHYSLKSANETKLWLELLRDTTSVKNKEIDWLIDEIDQISRIFGSSLLKLKSK